MAHSINTNDLKQKLSATDTPALLDVRRRADYENDPRIIPGAVWRNPEEIDTWIEKLEKTARPLVYCVKGGSVSQSVTERLREEGFDAVFLEGGLKAWTEDGHPVQRARSKSRPYTILEEDIALLKKAGMVEADIAHSRKVAQKALEIAGRTDAELDMELIGRGALFHDLGKAQTHEMEHGRIGAEMGAAMGLPESITTIMEKHIRGGLTKEEAIELNLPVKDYTLYKLEERIIIYADRLVDIITDGIVSIADERDAESRFEEILRTIPKYGKNDKTLGRYLGYHREIQQLAFR